MSVSILSPAAHTAFRACCFLSLPPRHTFCRARASAAIGDRPSCFEHRVLMCVSDPPWLGPKNERLRECFRRLLGPRRGGAAAPVPMPILQRLVIHFLAAGYLRGVLAVANLLVGVSTDCRLNINFPSEGVRPQSCQPGGDKIRGLGVDPVLRHACWLRSLFVCCSMPCPAGGGCLQKSQRSGSMCCAGLET